MFCVFAHLLLDFIIFITLWSSILCPDISTYFPGVCIFYLEMLKFTLCDVFVRDAVWVSNPCFCVCVDQDGLLWLPACWRCSDPEDEHFLSAPWEKFAAVFRSAQPLQDGAEAVWRSLHAGVLPQLWVWCFGASDNTRLEPHSRHHDSVVSQRDGLDCSN